MQCKFRHYVLAMLALLCSASAAADERLRLPINFVELLSGWRHADETDEFHVIGIHLQLLNNWKTFWRVPGGVGLPPRLDWSESRNVKSVETLWPVPSIFSEGDASFLGYEKEVVLPVYLWPDSPSEDIVVFLNFEFAVCNEICIPTAATLSAKLSAKNVIPDPGIVEQLNNLHANFRVGDPDETPSCQFTASEYGHEVTFEYALSPFERRDVHVVLEYQDSLVQFEKAEVQRDAERLVATSFMYYFGERAVAIDRSAIRSTAIFDGEAIEFHGCVGS